MHRSQNGFFGFGVYQAIGMSPVPWRKLHNVGFLRKHEIIFPEEDFVFEGNGFHWLITSYGRRFVHLNKPVIGYLLGCEGQSTSRFRKRDVEDEDESEMEVRKAGAAVAHYMAHCIANQNLIGFRLLQCDSGVRRCRLQFLQWVTRTNGISNIVNHVGDDKITATFWSVKAHTASSTGD